MYIYKYMTHDKQLVPVGPNEVIGPDRFGPSLWQGLHYITLGYPIDPTEEQKQSYKTFFILLKDTLPCSLCANHYAENLKKMPLTDEVLVTRENLVKWLIDFHNVVNEMKGKQTVEYQLARRMIDTDRPCRTVEHFDQETKQKTNNNTDMKLIYGLIGILSILVLIAVIYKKN